MPPVVYLLYPANPIQSFLAPDITPEPVDRICRVNNYTVPLEYFYDFGDVSGLRVDGVNLKNHTDVRQPHLGPALGELLIGEFYLGYLTLPLRRISWPTRENRRSVSLGASSNVLTPRPPTPGGASTPPMMIGA